jgi:hypothetical protein
LIEENFSDKCYKKVKWIWNRYKTN